MEGVDPLGVVVAPGVEGPDVEELEFEAPAIQLLVATGNRFVCCQSYES